MKTLIIIPAYNEQANIGALLDELERDYGRYDYLVINDCSRDGTRQILKSRRANYLDLPVNLGIGGGVQAGYMYAKENGYDIAVQMDGDGQHLCQEQHGLHIVQAHGLHIFSRVAVEKVGSFEGVSPLFQINTANTELAKHQRYLSWEMRFADGDRFAAKGLA